MATWTTIQRVVETVTSPGWGLGEWGTSPWGGSSGTTWTKLSKTSKTWTMLTKTSDSWTKIAKAS